MRTHHTMKSMLLRRAVMLLAIGGLLCSTSLWAQVNMERDRPKNDEGFSLNLDGSLTLIRGNVNLSQVGLSMRSQYIKGPHSPFIKASVSYAEKEAETFINQSFVHARWTTMWHETVGSETFIQFQEDIFRSLILRQLYGGGARLNLSTWSRGEFIVGLGYMFERETYREGAIEVIEENHRSTNYISAKHRLNFEAQVTVSDTLYYQPKFGQIDDYRLLNDLILDIKLTSLMSIVETLTVFYDSTPPDGVNKYDIKNMTSVRLSF